MDLGELVNKVMHDRKFYEAFKKNAVTALHEHKIKLTPEQVDAIKKINWEVLDKIAEVFSYRVT